METVEIAVLRRELETASTLDVFAAPWFPSTLHPLALDRLLGLLDRAVNSDDVPAVVVDIRLAVDLADPAHAARVGRELVRNAAVMELAQRYASRPPVAFDTEVPHAATRAVVRAWWKRTFTKVATDPAIAEIAYFCRHELEFGYDADATVRTGAAVAAACRGDRTSLLGALRAFQRGCIGLLGAGTPPSLLEVLLDTDESLRWTCVGVMTAFGQTALLDELVREAAAPSVGSVRHRGRVARQGAAMLEHASRAARSASGNSLTQHLPAPFQTDLVEESGEAPKVGANGGAGAEPGVPAWTGLGWLARSAASVTSMLAAWVPGFPYLNLPNIASSHAATPPTASADAVEAASQEDERKRAAIERLERHGHLSSLLAPAVGLGRQRWPVLDVLSEDALPLGGSRFGGLPDLPPDVSWPTWGDEPLDFMLQINLAEAAEAATAGGQAGDDTALLPTRGWLWYFFDTEMDGYETSIPESKLLLYWDGPVSVLRRRTRHPRDTALEDADVGEFGTGYGAHPLVPCRITTVSQLDPPPTGFAKADMDALHVLLPCPWDLSSSLEPHSDTLRGPRVHLAIGDWSADVHMNCLQLLGHPTVIQYDIFHGLPTADNDEHEVAEHHETDDLDTGVPPAGSADAWAVKGNNAGVDTGGGQPLKRQRTAEASSPSSDERWLLLLQIPSDNVRYYAGDHRRQNHGEINDHLLSAGGTLYVCIRRRDLVAHQFNRTLTVYQQT